MIFVYLIGFMLVLFIIIKMLDGAGNLLTKAQGFSSQALSLTHIGGIPMMEEWCKSNIGTKPDELLINFTHKLPLKQVKRVQHLTEDQLVDKQKSVIKRALVDGLLIGPIAAIIGGISGTGTKKVKEVQQFLSLDFIDKNEKEMVAIFLVGENGISDLKRFIKDVNQKIGHQNEVKEKPTIGNPYDI